MGIPQLNPLKDAKSHAKRVTLRDVAKALGISHVSVSLGLKNCPRISAALREKIHKKAEELGYKRDPMLSALAHHRWTTAKTKPQATFAWINNWSHPAQLKSYREFDAYWKGAVKSAENLGYRIEEFILDKKMTVQRLQRTLIKRNIRGLLIPPQRPPIDWEDFNWEYFATVRFGNSIEYPEVNSVSSDQASNTMLACRKIRERGYKRIGLVVEKSPKRMFLGGYMTSEIDTPEKQKLSPLLLKNESAPCRLLKFETWLKEYKPDAILTEVADLPQMLNELGWRVPQDVGLAATTVLDIEVDAGIFQNPEEIGRAAILTLIAQIHDNAFGIPTIAHQLLIEGKWVDGPMLPRKRKS